MPTLQQYKIGRQPIKALEAKKIAAKGVAGLAEISKGQFIVLFGISENTYDFFLASYRDHDDPRLFRRIDPAYKMLKKLGFKRFVVELSQ